MTKLEFLDSLSEGLSGLPREIQEESLEFYNEMIDDRIEEGLSEEQAVAAVGDVESIVSRIVADVPLSSLVKEKIKPKKHLAVWEIVLLCIGAPLWVPLLIVALALALTVYAVIWVVDVVLWAVFASLAGVSLGGTVLGVLYIVMGSVLGGIALLGAAILCAGLAIFAFFGCSEATKGIAHLSARCVLKAKKRFAGRKEASHA
ncbi:MAG: DUF1700 domain-containing protein [Ruminococcaceae bacterium]|nr:DUF1700 domain-containing protein [Oscillospiraceae bacterium]